MSSFSKGMVVQLVSGGPKMSVSGVGDYSGGMGMGPADGVNCVWFDAKNSKFEEVFDAAVLKEVVELSASGRLVRG
jgi:uncharacterized protein YodC (DUF2158 family)